MDELSCVAGGDRCATNQVYYSLSGRGPGFDLVPWLQQRGVVTMAYSPIDQGALAANTALAAIAERRGLSAAQLALAWLVAQPGVLAIPKATGEAHLRENLAARDIVLDDAERAALDRAFPPPRRKTSLRMI
jgi:diketogulonate reductase-like aldo/keto reductase